MWVFIIIVETCLHSYCGLTFCYIFVCYSHLRQCYCYIRLFFKLFLFKRLLNTNWCFLSREKFQIYTVKQYCKVNGAFITHLVNLPSLEL